MSRDDDDFQAIGGVVLDRATRRLRSGSGQASILSNLLTNAAKFTGPGGSIALRADSDEFGLTLRIRDSGIGIAPESMPGIFDMFSQVVATHERPDEGLGIGLALAKGFAELHGGTLEVESRGLGEGAEFTLRMPARRN